MSFKWCVVPTDDAASTVSFCPACAEDYYSVACYYYGVAGVKGEAATGTKLLAGVNSR